jgi:hypothetical protein
VNSGEDCFDLLSEPGKIHIHGEGTYVIVGGTGRFATANGNGAYEVDAVATPGIGSASGTFDLQFFGTIANP